MQKTTQFPLLNATGNVMHRLALFAVFLAWCAPAAGQSYTGWPLAGLHLTQPCTTCHKNNVYKGTPKDCFTCHQTAFQTSVNPPHVAAGFPTTCDTCHKFSDSAWKPASFNHNTSTAFALAGIHTSQACTVCHVNGVYKGTPTTCAGCHMNLYAKNYNNSKNPPHLAGGFATTCDTCHLFSASAWSPSVFNHSTATTFPLAGVHATQTCATCHKTTPYKNAPTTCVGCHQTDFNTAKSPVDHIGSNYPTTCDSCHKFSDANWMLASFSHTTFPLAGVHATTACATCHNPPYAPSANNTTAVPTTCYGCHVRDFTGATTPVSHTGFPTTCDTCHKNTDTSWSQKGSFSHNVYFQLVAGPHLAAACATCHNPPYAPSANNYIAVPTTCYGCHLKDFTGATTPVPHTGFPTACDTCHRNTDATWSQKGSFAHNTYFTLSGAHQTATCATCHNPPYAPSANNYISVPTSPCSGCHIKDYNTAKTPVDHIVSNFPTTCDSCHKFTDTLWSQATFSHSTFPLVGVHQTTACATCHNPPYAPAANNYTAVPTTCYGCHVRDFTGAAAKLPVPHTGFPTTCDSCHKNTDATWSQKGSFVHNAYFTLSGAHSTATCAQCHNPPYAPSANNYIAVPTSPCSGCHMKDYTTALTPVNHITAGYPTTCDLCHKYTDITWLVATAFTHSAFPQNHGNANACANCHTTPGQFLSPFYSCTVCHAKSSMDSKHQGRSGYSYVSTACYACHPRGKT